MRRMSMLAVATVLAGVMFPATVSAAPEQRRCYGFETVCGRLCKYVESFCMTR